VTRNLLLTHAEWHASLGEPTPASDDCSCGWVPSFPVISLWQPWASLVALGVKTIETRSWPAPKSVIGQIIAIHAAKRGFLTHRGRFFDIGDYTVERDDPRGCAEPAFLLRGRTLAWPYRLPLGAIVATVRLAACLPITDRAIQGKPTISRHDGQFGYAETLWQDDGRACWSITDQLPYGDFRPGRWAWMFEDVQVLNPPVPFRGGQGFSRRWSPES
jgi:activating signal cointegrator 1